MPVPRDGSKYNMATAPPYQVSFTHSMNGKVFSGSKRRVNFSFGFADPKALEAGATGPDARGEEHHVNLIWSVASGKRVVTMDGEEVHFSHGKSMEGRFETSWSLGNSSHMIKLVAHSSHALFQPVGFRPFDLFIDGLSFWKMPRIYELGFEENLGSHTKGTQQSVQSPSLKRSTEHDFARPPPSPTGTHPETYPPSQRPMDSPTGVTDVAALDQQNAAAAKEQKNQVSIDLFDAVAAPPVQQFQQPAMDDFSPAPPAPPSFEMVSHQVMSAYGPPNGTTPSNQYAPQNAIVPVALQNNAYQQQPQPANGFVPATPPTYHNQAPAFAPYQQPEAAVPPSPYYQPVEAPAFAATPPPQNYPQQPMVTPPRPQAPGCQEATDQQPPAESLAVQFPLTMEKLSLEEMEERQAPTSTPTEKALHSLVNLDDLNETFVSPQQRKSVEQKEAAAVVKSSKPLPPVVTGNYPLGLQPKLAELQQGGGKSAPPKEIMRMHQPAAAAQAGMMVMYGAPAANTTTAMPMYYQQQQQQQRF